jgi:hypothetical protein
MDEIRMANAPLPEQDAGQRQLICPERKVKTF